MDIELHGMMWRVFFF